MCTCCEKAERLKPASDASFREDQAHTHAVERCRGLHATEDVLVREIKERQERLRKVREEMEAGRLIEKVRDE